jgi:transcription factor E
MLDKFLKEIVTITVGKQAENITELLNVNKHVNEFTIAKKMDLTINQTRNILYKLSDFGLVASIRKKDKKKGWYTYFWKFEILKCLEFLKGLLTKRFNELGQEISDRQKKMFYECASCNLEYNEEAALLMDFTCDECGQIFSTKDDKKYVKDLGKMKDKIEEKLKHLEVEVEKELVIIGKKREKEFKKEQKEKDIKKAEAAAKRKATREAKLKAEGKLPKKKVVKKVAKKKVAKKKVVKKKPVKKKVVKKKVAKKPIKKKIVKNKPLKKKVVKKKVVKKKAVKKAAKKKK